MQALAPIINFNPRSLAGATCHSVLDCSIKAISIHAPLRERPQQLILKLSSQISIHAPLRERLLSLPLGLQRMYFNPRSLAGATAYSSWPSCTSHNFNPRSLAGATLGYVTDEILKRISIHAPLRERPVLLKRRLILILFQSTLPCGSDRCLLDTQPC